MFCMLVCVHDPALKMHKYLWPATRPSLVGRICGGQRGISRRKLGEHVPICICRRWQGHSLESFFLILFHSWIIVSLLLCRSVQITYTIPEFVRICIDLSLKREGRIVLPCGWVFYTQRNHVGLKQQNVCLSFKPRFCLFWSEILRFQSRFWFQDYQVWF